MQYKLNFESLTFFFVLLYCVVPNYIKLMGIPINYLFACIGIMLIIFSKKRLVLSKKGSRVFVLLNILLILPMLYHKELLNIISNFVTNIVLVIYLFYYIDNESKFLKFIKYLIIGSFFIEVISIFEFFSQINIFEMLSSDYIFQRTANSYRFGFLRISSSFYNSINYCIFLFFISVVIRYALTVKTYNKKALWFFNITYYITIICSLMTMSRGVIIVMLATNILIVAFTTESSQKVISILKWIMILLFIYLVALAFGVDILNIIINIFNLIFSVFSSSVQVKVANTFGTNVQAIGDRFNIYSWVYQDMGGYLLLGKGTYVQFCYIVNEFGHKKTSIENQFLLQFFRYGYIGLAAFVTFIIYCIKVQIRQITKVMIGEKYAFPLYGLLLTVGYIVIMFTVSVGEDLKLFYIIMTLVMSYSYNITNEVKNY